MPIIDDRRFCWIVMLLRKITRLGQAAMGALLEMATLAECASNGVTDPANSLVRQP